MESDKLVGLIIAGTAIIGGLAIGAIAIIVSVPWSYKEKLAKLEAANKERLIWIEKGVDPDQALKKRRPVGQDPLFWGLLLIGIGAGTVIGLLINFGSGMEKQTMREGLAVLLGGVAVVIYYFYRKRSADQTPS